MPSKQEMEKAEFLKRVKKPLRTDGSRKIIEPWIQQFIKSHAKSSPREIYGWLIGRESMSGEIYVMSAIACQRYVSQHFIGASPDPREVSELGAALPQGLGMIGIYHSHPADIFHSSVDDRTLQNLAKFYKKILSAVSNGDNTSWSDDDPNTTRWFQLNEDGKSTDQIMIVEDAVPREKFQILNCYGFLKFDITVPLKKNLTQQVMSVLMGSFQNIWDGGNIEFLKTDKKELEKTIKNKPNPNLVQKPHDILGQSCLTVEKKKLIKELNEGDIKSFMNADNLCRINMELISPNQNQPTPEGHIKIKGELCLLAINLFDRADGLVDTKLIIDKIKSEFTDGLMQNVARGLLRITPPDHLELHTAMPVFLPYPGIPFKLTLFLENIVSIQDDIARSINENIANYPGLSLENFPKVENFIKMEDETLHSMFKRSLVLATSGNKDLAILLLNTIVEIHRIRGNNDKANEIINAMSLVKAI
jgi:proteasome lid subunit RPN8/RPN11